MLNDRLYRLLVKQLGEKNVRVVRRGQKMKGRYENDWSDEGKYTWFHRKESGEEYHVNCWYCSDHRRRLSISYLFGQKDGVTGSKNLWAANCWNSGCLSDRRNQLDLYERLFRYDDYEPGEGPAAAEAEEPEPPKVPTMPGKLWRLDQLAERMPRHDAVRYAQDRLLCPEYLGTRWGVGYCPEPKLLAAENRLIAPVYFRGKFSGWTGRYIGEPERKTIPKWYHDPGMAKGQLLYNFDAASLLPTKILVEGAGDVWGVGEPGMGCLGNKITSDQLTLLRGCSQAENAVLVVLFDPKQGEKDIAQRKDHHLELAYAKLCESRELAARTLKVYLSLDLDPGDSDRSYVYRLIARAASQQKLNVWFPEN